MSKILKKSYIFAVGRRKTAVARVRLIKKGENKITVNQQDYQKYFPTYSLQGMVIKPLKIVNLAEKNDFDIKVAGGGKNSQAEAVRLGIARTFVLLDKELKSKLKKANLLKRDSRKKERKKPGLKRARRAPQWSKR
jgi:small subunit ribosomal protein S9